MKTLKELLKDENNLKNEIQKNGSFGYMSKGTHLKEILKLNKQYRKDYPTEYGYNDNIVEYIMKKENIPAELKNITGIQVYFSQRDLEEKKKKEYENKMLLNGWSKLTEEIVKEAIEKNKKVELNAKTTNDWSTFKVNKVLKPHCFNGRYGLMETRAKTRGYSLSQFEDAFCKLV